VPTELHDTPVSADRVRAMLQEIVRQAVARMIARQESDTPISDPEVHFGQIGAEGAQIREAQRARDWSVAWSFAGEIASQNGMDPNDVAAPAVARQILALMRQLNDLSLRVEKDFDDPLHAGRDPLLNHGIAPTRNGLATVAFRSLNSFRLPFVRRPRGFCRPAMNDAVVDYRIH